MLDPSALPITSMLTRVELTRTLRLLGGTVDRATARLLLDRELARFALVAVDVAVLERAALIVEQQAVKTLDAVHIASALEVGATEFVTFDRQQAAAARRSGLAIPSECGV